MNTLTHTFPGKPGTLTLEVNNRCHEVWFEGRLLGLGVTQTDALNDAARHVGEIGELIGEAMGQVLGGDSGR